MDPEDQTDPLLAPSAEYLASIPVFPLIPYLKKDVIVSRASYSPKQILDSTTWFPRQRSVRIDVFFHFSLSELGYLSADSALSWELVLFLILQSQINS